jgi:hypothetical protein
VSIAGGWCGSLLLTRTDEAIFSRLVPFLILFATLLFLAQGHFDALPATDSGTYRLLVQSRPPSLRLSLSVRGGGLWRLLRRGYWDSHARDFGLIGDEYPRDERPENRPRLLDQFRRRRLVRVERSG